MVFGELVKPALQTLSDLSAREFAILAPLVVVTLLIGVYPQPILDVTGVSVEHLLSQTRTPGNIATPGHRFALAHLGSAAAAPASIGILSGWTGEIGDGAMPRGWTAPHREGAR